MQTIKIICPNCDSEQLNKHGKTSIRKQRYYCKNCNKTFITDHSYNACKPEVKKFIIPMTLNSSGIRHISRVLHISTNTVLSAIKKAHKEIPSQSKIEKVISVEVDEQWSYVGSKGNQQWLWYAWNPDDKKVVEYLIGKRSDENCQTLIEKLRPYNIEDYFTDNWQSYSKYIPALKRFISKIGTQRIERNNLNLRTHIKRLNRKTICFSKSENMHKAVIGLYMHHTMTQQHF